MSNVTTEVKEQATPQTTQDQLELTPARAAVILIEAVDMAQKAGGVYSLEDAAVLAAAKKVLLSAISIPEAPQAEAPQSEQEAPQA